ncbi:hypothetical protein [Bacillus velezensis]|uniref:hypothetical protein n=1 Tax=Bacillus velezensis TaxID=492670 RepID=UPI001E30FDD1|nr:hypothetical protein [Bacillus velezensis]
MLKQFVSIKDKAYSIYIGNNVSVDMMISFMALVILEITRSPDEKQNANILN